MSSRQGAYRGSYAKRYVNNGALADPNAGWRSKVPSDSQVKFVVSLIRKKAAPYYGNTADEREAELRRIITEEKKTSGDVSQMIDFLKTLEDDPAGSTSSSNPAQLARPYINRLV